MLTLTKSLQLNTLPLLYEYDIYIIYYSHCLKPLDRNNYKRITLGNLTVNKYCQ